RERRGEPRRQVPAPPRRGARHLRFTDRAARRAHAPRAPDTRRAEAALRSTASVRIAGRGARDPRCARRPRARAAAAAQAGAERGAVRPVALRRARRRGRSSGGGDDRASVDGRPRRRRRAPRARGPSRAPGARGPHAPRRASIPALANARTQTDRPSRRDRIGTASLRDPAGRGARKSVLPDRAGSPETAILAPVEQTKVVLDESALPRRWYNIRADLPN